VKKKAEEQGSQESSLPRGLQRGGRGLSVLVNKEAGASWSRGKGNPGKGRGSENNYGTLKKERECFHEGKKIYPNWAKKIDKASFDVKRREAKDKRGLIPKGEEWVGRACKRKTCVGIGWRGISAPKKQEGGSGPAPPEEKAIRGRRRGGPRKKSRGQRRNSEETGTALGADHRTLKPLHCRNQSDV